jgi:signal transduction histidine kinase
MMKNVSTAERTASTPTFWAKLERIPLFWRIQLVAWPAFGLLTLPLKFGLMGSWTYVVFATLYREPLGLLLTSGLRVVFHRGAVRSMKPLRLGFTVISLAMLGSAFDTFTFWWIFDYYLQIKSDQSIWGLFSARSLIYCVWSFLYFWIKDQMDARERQFDLIRAETAARDAEILMLRAQVAPHFLFNAFNAILADLDRRPASLVPVVQGLSDYFRYSLTTRQETFVPLGGEYDAMINYLTVEKARFRDSLVIESHIDPSVRDFLVPGIFLQPLVENALKFGHQTSPTPLRLGLRITRTAGGGARIEVTNSGCWVNPPAARLPHEVGGCGLSNLRQRLSLLYRDQAHLEIPLFTAEGDVSAQLTFPAPH